jgi:hypothetical protein
LFFYKLDATTVRCRADVDRPCDFSTDVQIHDMERVSLCPYVSGISHNWSLDLLVAKSAI